MVLSVGPLFEGVRSRACLNWPTPRSTLRSLVHIKRPLRFLLGHGPSRTACRGNKVEMKTCKSSVALSVLVASAEKCFSNVEDYMWPCCNIRMWWHLDVHQLFSFQPRLAQPWQGDPTNHRAASPLCSTPESQRGQEHIKHWSEYQTMRERRRHTEL